jgi:hypothetical protein
LSRRIQKERKERRIKFTTPQTKRNNKMKIIKWKFT